MTLSFLPRAPDDGLFFFLGAREETCMSAQETKRQPLTDEPTFMGCPRIFRLVFSIVNEEIATGNRIISPENQNFYNISLTLHGFLMIFFLVMPGLFGPRLIWLGLEILSLDY